MTKVCWQTYAHLVKAHGNSRPAGIGLLSNLRPTGGAKQKARKCQETMILRPVPPPTVAEMGSGCGQSRRKLNPGEWLPQLGRPATVGFQQPQGMFLNGNGTDGKAAHLMANTRGIGTMPFMEFIALLRPDSPSLPNLRPTGGKLNLSLL